MQPLRWCGASHNLQSLQHPQVQVLLQSRLPQRSACSRQAPLRPGQLAVLGRRAWTSSRPDETPQQAWQNAGGRAPAWGSTAAGCGSGTACGASLPLTPSQRPPLRPPLPTQALPAGPRSRQQRCSLASCSCQQAASFCPQAVGPMPMHMPSRSSSRRNLEPQREYLAHSLPSPRPLGRPHSPARVQGRGRRHQERGHRPVQEASGMCWPCGCTQSSPAQP